MTYAIPTLADRRKERSARVAYYASILVEHDRLFAGVPFEERDWHAIAMCVSCGANTGNWCDTCENQGRHYTTRWGQVMVGTPLCSRCEDDATCVVCGA